MPTPTQTVIVQPSAQIVGSGDTSLPVDATGAISMLITQIIGATDTDWLVCKLQNSPDGMTWNDVAGGDYSLDAQGLPQAGDTDTTWEWVITVDPANPFMRIVFTVNFGVSGSYVTMIAAAYAAALTGSDANAHASLTC